MHNHRKSISFFYIIMNIETNTAKQNQIRGEMNFETI